MKVNIEKAKIIAHDKRRAVRAEKFAPLDIRATIPSEADAAEAERQSVRDEDAVIQISIDDSTDADSLMTVMKDAGLV